jgi:DNA-directed RNA polymerase subunit RPC12/RpoP
MEILNHWKGTKLTCIHCGTQFVLDAEDIASGTLCTDSDAMLRAIKNGINAILYVQCPHCSHRVNISGGEIPMYYKSKARVVP